MIWMASATILKRGTEKRHQSRVYFKLKPYTKREHRRVMVYMEWRILIYGSPLVRLDRQAKDNVVVVV